MFLCTSSYMTCHHFHTALQCLLLSLQEQVLSEHLITLLRATNASSVVSRRTRQKRLHAVSVVVAELTASAWKTSLTVV